ncbi:MORC family CW-type zinc finger protein 3a [Lampris incognitus]|uniref:MORC family CW-type zinc finger protein 3a n=1 Tax=Lampris incognitus TaxID=2546036 RepID=UPI0024B5D617|nr:MORC family CW-type zinc finger protein 3a [Lampris incognitus]
MAATQSTAGVPVSTLNPKFLHTNSTSHTWPFSAIAELIDNAYDPDVSATKFWIDKTEIKGQLCLVFMDNGNGLIYETMHKMLSFGYSDKPVVNGQLPIGIYGNGFKSGSMRLGKDAIVFSKRGDDSCVGMLSQSYLETIGAKQIIVPIVSFKQKTPNREQHRASLQHILQHSLFNTREELFAEIKAINSTFTTETSGTRIIIWNLRRTSTETSEFDFAKDRYDIQIPSEAVNERYNLEQLTSSIPECVYSLHAYCRILYLKPRMQIMIRGQKVKTQLISKNLAHIAKDRYKPAFLNRAVSITFGYNTKSKDQYGIMMYHKNRLIKFYERVGCQLKASNKGVGVIGVVECNFLEPTHNKQDFDNTDKYRKMMSNLGIKLEEYWKEIRHMKNSEDPNSTVPVEDTKKRPDQNWVQCDLCLKWRKLPDGIDDTLLPDKWFCSLNPDPQFRGCHVEEEPEDSDDEQPTYQKTYKKREREEKRNQERKKKLLEEDKKRQEVERRVRLALQNKEFERKNKKMEQQLNMMQQPSRLVDVRSPSTPSTSKRRASKDIPVVNLATALSSPPSTAACSSSSDDTFPKILNVCSLSTTPLGVKRNLPTTPQSVSKRSKPNELFRSTSGTTSSAESSPMTAPPTPANPLNEADDSIANDEDVDIFETVSTPASGKMKRGPQPSDSGIGMQKEGTIPVSACRRNAQDDTSLSEAPTRRADELRRALFATFPANSTCVDVAMETNAEGTSSTDNAAVGNGPSPPSPQQVNIMTQTEPVTVKQEQDNVDNGIEIVQIKQEWEDGTEQPERRFVMVEEAGGDDTRVGNQGAKTFSNGTIASDTEDGAGSSRLNPQDAYGSRRISEAQEQQQRLMALMQTTAEERDSLKGQVHQLTQQLRDAENRLQEMSRAEEAAQAGRTQGTEGEQDYMSVFDAPTQRGEVLRIERETSPAACLANSSAATEEKETREIALQTDGLVPELDECIKERDERRSQVERLERENTNLLARCEQLKLNLEQLRADTERDSTSQHTATRPVVRQGEEASGTASTSDTNRNSLLELRHNVGQLLASFVPGLELDQVNYECNVIDEMLEQVLSNQDFIWNLK